MTDDTIQALSYIPCHTVTYQEWVWIGMALKDAGCSVDVWDSWSQTDSARYNPGECQQKWRTFNGSGRTVATIFDLAKQHGYKPTPMQTTPPEKWIPEHDLIRYIQALFEPTDIIGYVTQSTDGRPANRGTYTRTAKDIIDAVRRDGMEAIGTYDTTHGAWIRANPLDGLGVKDANVVAFKHGLVESDSLTIQQQARIYQKLNLPIAALVHSGNKSLHAIVTINAPDIKTYRKRMNYLYSICSQQGLDVDIQNKNPSRLSRMPGIVRGNQTQHLVAINIGAASWEEWAKSRHTTSGTIPELANHTIVEGEKGGTYKVGRYVADISHDLLKFTDGWPKRVGRLLFHDPQDGTVRWLESNDDVFAWMHERIQLRWSSGAGTPGYPSLVTKPEFACHLSSIAENYDNVELLPHEPPIPGLYYAWHPEPNGDGLVEFEKLLAFFNNPETEHDAALIRASFLTPAWGGMAGTRPALAVMSADRGSGKSTLADAIACLYRGKIDVPAHGADEGKLAGRFLSPLALTTRIVVMDNIKTVQSNEIIESIITSPSISGHRLYAGEATRPNHLTWILTGNAIRLSRDLAERSFFIRLTKPKPVSGWREAIFNHIETHRDAILRAIIHMMRQPPQSPPAGDRWQSWVDAVLTRCTSDATATVKQNQNRRNESDDDLEESIEIQSAILYSNDITWTESGTAFVTSSHMADVINKAMGKHLSTKGVNNIIRNHLDAGRLYGISHMRTMGARGYQIDRMELSGDAS